MVSLCSVSFKVLVYQTVQSCTPIFCIIIVNIFCAWTIHAWAWLQNPIQLSQFTLHYSFCHSSTGSGCSRATSVILSSPFPRSNIVSGRILKMFTREAPSTWTRKLDFVYLFFFVLHIVIMLGTFSCTLIWPTTLLWPCFLYFVLSSTQHPLSS